MDAAHTFVGLETPSCNARPSHTFGTGMSHSSAFGTVFGRALQPPWSVTLATKAN